MSRLTFTILWIILAGGLLTFMVLAWRARARRDAGITLPHDGLAGEIVETFPRVSYVSTTPEDDPFERIAAPGLSFKGWAEVVVREDGVEITVTGEETIMLTSDRVVGADTASGRIGKVVEKGGLAVVRWVDWLHPVHSESRDTSSGNTATSSRGAPRVLESSFRCDTPAEQHRLVASVNRIAAANPTEFIPTTTTSQEDS